jgi:hypothetical protein
MAQVGQEVPEWRRTLGATLAEASGGDRRKDPRLPRTGGPAGNARITAWTGFLLLVLSLAELVTLLDVHALISWHVVLGALLLPPALLKTASTGWRIVRYYTGNRVYRTAGPPPLLLRILGPFVVAATLGLLVSGIVLVALGPDGSQRQLVTFLGQRVDWVSVHQGLFVVWGVLTGLHVLGRLLPAVGIVVTRPAAGDRVAGRIARGVVLAATIAVAALTAALLLAAAPSWRGGNWGFHGRQDFHRRVGAGALGDRVATGSGAIGASASR